MFNNLRNINKVHLFIKLQNEEITIPTNSINWIWKLDKNLIAPVPLNFEEDLNKKCFFDKKDDRVDERSAFYL